MDRVFVFAIASLAGRRSLTKNQLQPLAEAKKGFPCVSVLSKPRPP